MTTSAPPTIAIAELNTQPVRALAIAPPPASRLTAYGSGSRWFATPFPYGSLIRSTLPVFWRFPRLASDCWPGFAGRGWLPAGFPRKVSELVTSHPPCPGLSWRTIIRASGGLQRWHRVGSGMGHTRRCSGGRRARLGHGASLRTDGRHQPCHTTWPSATRRVGNEAWKAPVKREEWSG